MDLLVSYMRVMMLFATLSDKRLVSAMSMAAAAITPGSRRLPPLE